MAERSFISTLQVIRKIFNHSSVSHWKRRVLFPLIKGGLRGMFIRNFTHTIHFIQLSAFKK